MARTLSIDIETYCELDLTKVGVYKYTSHPSFEILMIAYAFDDEQVEILDLYNGSGFNSNFRDFEYHLKHAGVIKSAFNANFERTALTRLFGFEMPPEQWRCTMIHATELGLPSSLGKVAEVLQLEDQKMDEGKALINYFSKPCKPTKANESRTRNLPDHDPEKWYRFKEYCKQDVETERTLRKRLERFPITENEQKLWELDQRMNDRGIRLDRQLMQQAIKIDAAHKKGIKAKLKELSGVDNPNSDSQIKDWIANRTDLNASEIGLNKADIADLIDTADDDEVSELLDIRAEMKKTSTSKYQAMERGIMDDDRVRGLLQFYGANRTGRWAGRLVQVQNLPRNYLQDLEYARELVKAGDYETLKMLFGNVPDTLSQLIRTTFIPEPGQLFYVSDFSAIEARVIAWLAGEKWRMNVFRTHGKIYEASASQMFGVPIEQITKDGPNYKLRQKGKVAELALGYGGSVGALIAMGALKEGLEEHELQPLVDAWRATSPTLVRFWWNIDAAAQEAITTGRITDAHNITFSVESGILFVGLPSGRRLAYIRPTVEAGKFGRDQIFFYGMDQTTKKWTKIDTYGPKLVENIVQAVSRDLLAHAMMKLESAGYNIVMHIHDEVVIEAPADDPEGTIDKINEIMGQGPDWAKGLPLGAAGFTSEFYMKD